MVSIDGLVVPPETPLGQPTLAQDDPTAGQFSFTGDWKTELNGGDDVDAGAVVLADVDHPDG